MFDIAVIIAVVLALTELFKRLGLVTQKYLPGVSLALGITASIVYIDGDINSKIMYGLMIGLSASGLFDQSKILKVDKHD